MKKIDFILTLMTILTIMLTGCAKEQPITYEDALKNCKPDTMKFVNFNGDTTKMPYLTPACVEGAQLPLFETTFMDGDSLKAEYFSQKINVINFWFIGCHPCEAEMPGFNALVEKYKTQPVNFLAISRNKPEDIQEFVADWPFNVDHIALGENITRDFFHLTWGYPTTIVTDANNKIIFTKSGGADDSTAVQKIQDELIPVIDGALKKM